MFSTSLFRSCLEHIWSLILICFKKRSSCHLASMPFTENVSSPFPPSAFRLILTDLRSLNSGICKSSFCIRSSITSPTWAWITRSAYYSRGTLYGWTITNLPLVILFPVTIPYSYCERRPDPKLTNKSDSIALKQPQPFVILSTFSPWLIITSCKGPPQP